MASDDVGVIRPGDNPIGLVRHYFYFAEREAANALQKVFEQRHVSAKVDLAADGSSWALYVSLVDSKEPSTHKTVFHSPPLLKQKNWSVISCEMAHTPKAQNPYGIQCSTCSSMKQASSCDETSNQTSAFNQQTSKRQSPSIWRRRTFFQVRPPPNSWLSPFNLFTVAVTGFKKHVDG
jgi:hypothetical protein